MYYGRNMGQPEQAASWHLGYLDSLRGIAVLAVVFVHSSGNQGRPLPLFRHLQWIAFTGQRGVSLFFVVSAFTLFLSHQNRRDERHPTLNFFVRRLFRLAPMFYIALAVSFVFLRQYVGGPWEFASSIFFLHGFSPATINAGAVGGGSVANEAIFYMTLPFLYRWIGNLNQALLWLAVGTVISKVLSRFMLLHDPARAWFFTAGGFPAHAPVFLLGILGFFVWTEMIQRSALSATRRKQLSMMILVLGALMYRQYLPFTDATLHETSVLCLLLLLALSLHPWTLLVNPVTRFLGRISYSLYLLHFVVFLKLQAFILTELTSHPLLRNVYVQFATSFIGTLAITVPVAFLSWKWIEQPGIHQGKRVITWIESTRTKRREVEEVLPQR
jgi:peptidoglycan/LPS O-acetylase OafA/YrhL